jgi:hypothetical protein
MEFSVNIFARFFKLVHALSQASGQIWQLLRAEKNEHDKKDDKYVRATEVSKAKCEYIHNSIDSAGTLVYSPKTIGAHAFANGKRNRRLEQTSAVFH